MRVSGATCAAVSKALLSSFTMLLSLSLGVAAAAATTATSKPNLLLIVADDQGYANIGYHNSTVFTNLFERLRETSRALL